MILWFVLFHLVFNHIAWYFVFIYAALTHSNETKHHFHRDHHSHQWMYYAVLQKYSFKDCVISYDFYWTRYKFYIHIPCIITEWRTTVPFNIPHVLSYSELWMPILYKGSVNHCEGDRNLDVIGLIELFLTIYYGNQ